MITGFIVKCGNVGNVTCAHVFNMQIVQLINFPHLPMEAPGGGPGLELLEYDHVFQNFFHCEMQIAQH